VHIGEQIAIGRRQHPHVDRPRPVLAHAPHLALLQDAQQLYLHRRRHVANFIEKQRAAIGRLEQAGAILRRARERAAGVSEELGLQQRFGHSSAVDREERPGRSRRFIVDEPRQALLAGPAFARDEDRRVDLRDPPGQIERSKHRGTRSDETSRRSG
jgi:hypothetical protein